MKLDEFDYYFTELVYNAHRTNVSKNKMDELCGLYRLYVKSNDLKYMYKFEDTLRNMNTSSLTKEIPRPKPVRVTFRMTQKSKSERDEKLDYLIQENAEMKKMMMTLMTAMAQQQDNTSVVDVNVASTKEMRKLSQGIEKLEKVAVAGQDLSSVEFKDLPKWLQDNFTKEMKKFAFNSVTFPFRVTKNVLNFTFVKAPVSVLSKGKVAIEIGAGIYVLALVVSGSITLYVNYKEEVDAILPYVTGPAHYFVVSPVTTTFGYLHEVTGLTKYANIVANNIQPIIDYLPSRQALEAARTLKDVGLFMGKGVATVGGKAMNIWNYFR